MENGAFACYFQIRTVFQMPQRRYYGVKGLATGGNFGFIKNAGEILNKTKSKDFLASSLSK